MTTITPGKLLGLRRLADRNGRFKMLAVDQRPPIEDMVAAARGEARADPEDVVAVKNALIETLSSRASAVLVDPQYSFPACIPLLPRAAGLLLTLEDHRFTETEEGRLSGLIPDWSVDKIRTAGADAVKLLAWYRPDAGEQVIEHQQKLVTEVGAACTRADIAFVFELLLYPFPGERTHTTGYVEDPAKRTEHVIESVETFAASSFGVDLFKLESPVPATAIAGPNPLDDHTLTSAFSALARAAGRPWVVLSAGTDQTTFLSIAEHALDAGASGYLAGRAIWWDAVKTGFPDMGRMGDLLTSDAAPYMDHLNDLTNRKGRSWTSHDVFGAEGPTPPAAGDDFRRDYPGRR